MATSPELLSAHACFGGVQRYYRHASSEIGLPMQFSLFLPPHANEVEVPLLVYLAGLTCNEETFMVKSGAQRIAAAVGIALLCPDTSPPAAGLPGECDSWDLGVGAGFYIDATQTPWSKHYRMESYLMAELLPLVKRRFSLDKRRVGIFGHSMGGHGALTLAFKYPNIFRSVSAFAPVCAPTQCPWGTKAFSAYLGADPSAWAAHDATALMSQQSRSIFPKGILIDQGLADKFLSTQLHPHLFEAACTRANQPLILRRHAGYDHGYYFVSTFMADHFQHHLKGLI